MAADSCRRAAGARTPRPPSLRRRAAWRASAWATAMMLLVGLGGPEEGRAQLFQAADAAEGPAELLAADLAERQRQVLPGGPDVSANYPDVTSQPCPNYPFTQTARCGPQHGGLRCRSDYCCSAWGYCGNESDWCEFSYGLACQLGYGRCWFDETVTCTNGPTLTPVTRTRTSTATSSAPPTTTAAPTTTVVPTTGTSLVTSRPTTATTGSAFTSSAPATTKTAATTSIAPTTATTASPSTASPSTSSFATTAAPTTPRPSTTTPPTRTTPSSTLSTTTTTPFPSDLVDPACSPYYEPTPTPGLRAFLRFLRRQDDLPPADACVLPKPPPRPTEQAQGVAQQYGTYAAVGAGVVGAGALGAWGIGEAWARGRGNPAAVV